MTRFQTRHSSFVIRNSPWLILLLAICIFVWHSSSSAFLQDDSYITYRYSRNIIRGLGPVFNPGERVEGYTNFLWMMLLASLGIIGIPFATIIPLSQIIGVLCGIGVMVLFFLIVRRHTRGPPVLASIVVFLLAANGSFAYWFVSGMETGLFTLLLAAAFFIYLKEAMPVGWASESGTKESRVPPRAQNTARNLFLCSSLLGLSALTRPEGALFMGIIVLHFVIQAVAKGDTPHSARVSPYSLNLKHLGLLVLPFVVLVAPLYIWRLSFYGYLFPNTFYAKTGFSLSYLRSGFEYLANFYKAYGFWGLAFIAPLALAILRRRLKLSSPLFFAVLVLVIHTLYVVSVGGDVLRIYRFFVPVLILFYFLLSEGIWLLPVPKPVQTGLLVALIPLTFWGPFAQPRSVRADINRNLYLEHGLVDKMSATGRWLNHQLGEDDWFACTTIGAVSYFSDRNMVDMLGLTDQVIAHSPEDILESKWHWKERNYNTRHVLERNPKYIYFSTGIKPSAEAERALFLRPRFRLGYFACPISIQRGDGISSEIVYKAKPGADTLPIDPAASPSGFVNLYLDAINSLRVGPDTAIACFQQCIDSSPPDFGYPYEWLGKLYLQQKRPDLAASCFEEAVARNDWCISSHTSLASIYAQKKDYSTAIQHMRKVVAYAPDYYDGYVNLTAVATLLRNFVEAEDVLTRALEKFPGIPDLKLRLAYVKTQAGKLGEAEAILGEFLRDRPGHRTALSLLEQIRAFRQKQPQPRP